VREAFDEILNSLSLTMTATSPPPDHGGDWFQVLTSFKTKGFLRCLVSWDEEEALLLVHFASPGISEAETAEMVAWISKEFTGTWRAFLMDGAQAILGRVAELNVLGPMMGKILRMSELVENSVEIRQIFSDNAPSDPVAPVEPEPTILPFEEIGEDDGPAAIFEPIGEAGSPNKDIKTTIREDHLEVSLTLSDAQRPWTEIRRTLRGMLDVDVELMENTSSHLRFQVRPADLGGPILTLNDIDTEVRRVLAAPSSPQGTGAAPQVPRAPSAHIPSSGVVFGLPSDGPLKPGDFEDARLSEPDSEVPLVDVVLRHPGYSDRRVGQVLSILLSIEYHVALRLMNSSPCVIAHGVSKDRGYTLKNMVENAGGRIQLTDPGRYPAG